MITSQAKAWNDTVRMAMCIDLILKPQADKRGGKLFLWQDNFSAHKARCLDEIYAEAGVTSEFLPPQMTDELQVMQLNSFFRIHLLQVLSIGIGSPSQCFDKEYDSKITSIGYLDSFSGFSC